MEWSMWTVKYKIVDHHGGVISVEVRGLPKGKAENLLASLACQPMFRGGKILTVKVMLIGNLGKDPEVRTIPSGVKVANFPIATSERYTPKDGGAKVEKTEWHNIVMWRGLAEIAEKYLRKGSQVYVEGKLQTRSWEADGVKKYMTEILVDKLVMLGGKRAEGGGEAGGDPLPPEDELPF
jgi:single-strand DNA-binding protein